MKNIILLPTISQKNIHIFDDGIKRIVTVCQKISPNVKMGIYFEVNKPSKKKELLEDIKKLISIGISKKDTSVITDMSYSYVTSLSRK